MTLRPSGRHFIWRAPPNRSRPAGFVFTDTPWLGLTMPFASKRPSFGIKVILVPPRYTGVSAGLIVHSVSALSCPPSAKRATPEATAARPLEHSAPLHHDGPFHRDRHRCTDARGRQGSASKTFDARRHQCGCAHHHLPHTVAPSEPCAAPVQGRHHGTHRQSVHNAIRHPRHRFRGLATTFRGGALVISTDPTASTPVGPLRPASFLPTVSLFVPRPVP